MEITVFAWRTRLWFHQSRHLDGVPSLGYLNRFKDQFDPIKATGMRGLMLASAILFAGCATTERCPPELVSPPNTCFERVGAFDFRPNAPGGPNSLDDFRNAVQPGDLVVTYMDFKRAVARRQWIFTVLPCGHAMMVVEPRAEKGILETRFHGAQMVGPEELLQYTNCQVYRLRDRSALDLKRLHEFCEFACRRVKKYDPCAWIGANGNMSPDSEEELSLKYTCSNFQAAAYHYAGVDLSAGRETSKVITPNSLAASIATPRASIPSPTQPSTSSGP